jgi:N-acyl-D-aspartate/D-glutamate deacylase
VVSDFQPDVAAEFGALRHMVESSGRPLSISVAAEDHRASWGSLRDRIADAVAAGLPVKGQVAARAIGLVLGLQATLNPFLGLATYQAIAGDPLDERVRKLRDPEVRARLLAEADQAEAAGERGRMVFNRFDKMFELTDPPDYEPSPDQSVAARAATEGRSPASVAYDLLLRDEGRAFLYFPLFNWVDGSLDAVGRMLRDENLLPGLGDGGAHVGTICDASFPTTLLSYWGRDRSDRLPVEWIIRRQCRDTAAAVGLYDRGVLEPGRRADLNVIDFEALRLHAPTMAFDLPAGGKRLLQRAEGYLHTFVAGEETYASGEPTGALPGRLVRGAR